MRHPARVFLLGALLMGAVLLWHDSLRYHLLIVLRLPFRIATHAVRIVVTLPRVPALIQENAQLQAALMQQQGQTAHLQQALRHATQAASLLDANPLRGVVAGVIGRSLLPTQHTLLLEKGRQDGIVLNSVVMDAAGIVGRVTELHPRTALVLLLTDPDSRVAALIERSRESGLLVGRSAGSCELIYLEVQADIVEGDRVVTAGLSSVFPKGLLLGHVTRIIRNESSGSAWASVTPAAHLGQVEEVLCVLPQQSSREP